MQRLKNHIKETERLGTVIASKSLEFTTISEASSRIKHKNKEVKSALIYCNKSFEWKLRQLLDNLSGENTYGEFEQKTTAFSYLCDYSFFTDGIEYHVVVKPGLKKNIVIPAKVKDNIYTESIIIQLG